MPGWGYTSPPGWKRTRRRVLQRDGWVCCSPGCRARADEVDHVVPRSQGGSEDPGNLRAICAPHHRAKSLRESGAIIDRRARPGEQHPGLVEPEGSSW